MAIKNSCKNIYLIGHERKFLSQRKLPTNREVLSLLMYNYKSLGKPLNKSMKIVIDEVNSVWSKTKIPVMKVQNSVEKLKNLYNKWIKVKQNSSRTKSACQKTKEVDFKLLSQKLFDIASQNKNVRLTNEQKIFLDNERKNQRRGIIPFDSEETNSDSEESLQELSKSLSICTISFESRTHSSHSLQRIPSNFEDDLPRDSTSQKVNIMTSQLTSALDRTNVSARDATIILAAAAESFGIPLENVNLCPSTVYRHRIKNRKSLGDSLKNNFKAPNALTVHWDGKLLPEMTGSTKVERLPVIITGLDCEQLLGVPKLIESTGLHQSEVIFELLQEWDITDKIGALCFDTTSVNTGQNKGVCKLLEKKIGKSLLNFACRHHIYELVLHCVFEIYWPITSGPKVPKFNEFQQEWPRINKNNYKTGLDDHMVAPIIRDKKDGILLFISQQLQENQPRDDYRELLELASVFLGNRLTENSTFKAPGPTHHARWLSKAIYCLKIFLFQEQFPLSRVESQGLRHICVFITLLYVKAWYCAPLSIQAPRQDLEFFKNLLQYKTINKKISEAASKKFSTHLWYLSEELICLSLFDDNVSSEIKIKIIESMNQKASQSTNLKRVNIKNVKIDSFMTKNLYDFASKKSIVLFERFQLPTEFLKLHPDQWKSDKDYNTCLTILKNLHVVNDTAERGVQLIESYNRSLTYNEEQKQYLLQVVAMHRKQFPNANKQTLMLPPIQK